MNKNCTPYSLFAKSVLAFIFVLGAAFSVKATHSMGANITYTCIGNGQYQITLQFFRDCGGITPGTTALITYSSATCGVNATLNINQVGGPVDVTPICASAQSNCGGGNGSFGVEQWTYQGILSLPANCGNDWVLGWSTCCRNNAVTTLSNPGNQNFYVEAELDNTLIPCNNSPVFNNPPTPVVCINQPVSYSHGVSDPDGDSLVFSLTNCQQSAGGNVAYSGGFSGANPLSTTSGTTINPATGTISFTPNSVQVGVICVTVEEYRNGVKIGEVVRDMQFRVINCSNVAPVASGIDGTALFQTQVCVGTNLCFFILGSDANADNVTMTWNNGIPTGTFTVAGNGSTAPTGTFCWTPTIADVGTNFFTVTVEDDACPLTGVSTFSYQIDVVGTPNTIDAGPNVSVCTNSSGTVLNATSSGALSYTWSPSAGLSCTNCQSPTANPTSTTVYTVTGTFSDGCTLSDNVTVTVQPDPPLSISPAVAYSCPGQNVFLTATSATATGYNWSTGATTASTTVSPATTTDFSVTVTDANGCVNADTVTVNIAAPSGTACNVIYASPGAAGVGTQADPADLVAAIGMASCNNTIIKLDIGTYNINTAITNLTSYVTLEGGFDQGNGWRKTSSAGASTINRTTANVESATGSNPRLTAFYINGQTDFRFQDLTIAVANAPSNGPGNRGISTYGVHMTNCSNYNFTRCQIQAGNGGVGDAGAVGAAGATGNPGSGGGDGHSDSQGSDGFGGNGGAGAGTGAGGGGTGAAANGGCCNTGTGGGNGGAASQFQAGGGGGGGARGGQEDRDGGSGGLGGGNTSSGFNTCGGGAGQESGCNPVRSSCQSGISGGNGCNGNNGGNGSAGAPGSAGGFVGGFWAPGGQGGTGTVGQGGQGGRGGGGGAGEGGFTCTDGAGAGGGGGGGGGQGGFGGTGGFGGGSSVAIYLFNNGANGQLVDCNVSAGSAGSGGNGGGGGNGGAGGNGGQGGEDQINDYEIGCGGDGGNGGQGGSGGNGGNGASGTSQAVRLDGGSSLTSSSTSFNLASQPVIFMENIACTSTDIDYSSGVSNNWNLGSGATNATPTGANVTTQYTSTGRKDILYGINTYTGFSNIILGSGVIPDAGTTAPIVAGEFRICAGDAVDFSALNPGVNYVYSWNMDGGSVPNTYNGTSFDVVTGATFNTPGDYYITLQYTTDCCGASSLDSIHLFVDPTPNMAIAGPTSFCDGDSVGVNLTASGASSYVWGPASGLNTTTGPTVTAYPTTTTTYTITGTNAVGNCSDATTVTVTVNDITLTPSSVDATCGANGTATITPSGGSGSYNFDWPALGQTTSSVTNLIPGNYQVIVTDAVTGCIDSTFVTVNPGPGALNPFVQNVVSTTCAGVADGSATVAHIGGAGPFVYTWVDTTTATPVGGNAATNTPLPAGTYAVTIFDIGNPGCPGALFVTVTEPDPVVVALVDTTSPTCPFLNDGIAEANASGGNGPYTYNWQTAPAQVGDSAINLSPGTYTVVATDANGCQDSVDIVLTGPSPCPFPVEYMYFTATPGQDEILLDWETASEDNNLGFEVMRSVNGTDFDQVGWVNANPNGTNGAVYSFADAEVQRGVPYFYKLNQRDIDGGSKETEVREAILPLLGSLEIQVYPTPVRDVVNLELELPEAARVSVDVLNVVGQSTGLSESYNLDAGVQVLTLNLRDLAAGMYLGKVIVDGVQAGSVKFMKID